MKGNSEMYEFDSFIVRSQEKWRELPGGDHYEPRVFSDTIFKKGDDDFNLYWRRQYDEAKKPHMRGWFQELYKDTFKGKRVLELGSGLGLDGTYFLGQGALWTFADIVPGNLAVVRRAVEMMKVGANASYVPIAELGAIDRLTDKFDVIWANGSMHHAPFAIAQEESRQVLKKLKPNGRWIELVYSRERWLREGSMPFQEWGKRTDGERTNWAEWYDAEKLTRRLAPANFMTVLEASIYNKTCTWIDLLRVGPDRIVQEFEYVVPLDVGMFKPHNAAKIAENSGAIWITCNATLWDNAATLDLSTVTDEEIEGDNIMLEIQCRVHRGAVGAALIDKDTGNVASHEAIVESSDYPQLLYLHGDAGKRNLELCLRNSFHGVPSQIVIDSIKMRFSE
jgi:SAM-dependent methyltransferase